MYATGNAANSTNNWLKNQNVSVLATSNLLSEVNDVIQEDREEEHLTNSRVDLDMIAQS